MAGAGHSISADLFLQASAALHYIVFHVFAGTNELTTAKRIHTEGLSFTPKSDANFINARSWSMVPGNAPDCPRVL